MIEDTIIRMYRLLDQSPQSEGVMQFETDCVANPDLLQTWHDFLIEQHLSQNLSQAWKMYLLNIPLIEEKIAFQQNIQRELQAFQEERIRKEIRLILPKDNSITNYRSGNTTRYLTYASIAAVGFLCIATLLNQLFRKSGVSIDDDIIPVLMVETFELQGDADQGILGSISQRVPVKLAATEGVYTLTHYAVDNVSRRLPETVPSEELGAHYSVRGTVERVGDKYHVQASLVDLEKNRALWNELFTSDDDPKAFDDLQDEMSMKIVKALKIRVSKTAQSRMRIDISQDPIAVDYFLIAERALNERTKESLEESMRLFQMALDLDSTSSLIRGYLALAHDTYSENDYDDHWEQALREANKTLQQDPDNPQALLVLGDHAETIEKDYAKAASYFAHALRIQPGDAQIHQAIAELHLRTGKIAIGLDHILTARTIEPERRVVRWIETKYLAAVGRLEDARDAADDLMLMYPDYPNIQNFYWIYHLSKGQYDLALSAIPSDRPATAQNYMRAMTYVEQQDFDKLHALYPEDWEKQNSLILMEHVQKDQWNEAHALLRKLLSEDSFDLLALSQTADFDMFSKLKSNLGVQQIYKEFGLIVNIIPDEPEI